MLGVVLPSSTTSQRSSFLPSPSSVSPGGSSTTSTTGSFALATRTRSGTTRRRLACLGSFLPSLSRSAGGPLPSFHAKVSWKTSLREGPQNHVVVGQVLPPAFQHCPIRRQQKHDATPPGDLNHPARQAGQAELRLKVPVAKLLHLVQRVGLDEDRAQVGFVL